MTTQYQLIILGEKSSFESELLLLLYKNLDELGISRDSILKLDETNFSQYKSNAPVFCLYFGKDANNFVHQQYIEILQRDSKLILPIVDNIDLFNKQIPKSIGDINGIQLSNSTELVRVVSCIFEGFGLFRKSRRLFISYKRDESSTVAIQLYEQLEKNGFDVFLDTHSVPKGEPFQDELWHRMVDSDIVIMLNTKSFFKSQWTKCEIAKANALSIGVIQLIWPRQTMDRSSKICVPINLNESDFNNTHYSESNKYVSDGVIENIVRQTESLRARTLAARHNIIIGEFVKISTKSGFEVDLNYDKNIKIKKKDGQCILLVPTIGVPISTTYHGTDVVQHNNIEESYYKSYILYDHLNVRKTWVQHLDWLDGKLPVKTLKLLDAEQWLKTI